ncbi:hypothetical protein A2U01_0016682 [Trifolium medium]|uniref:Uncharacterized protein n=1 Tax=Trifolium medium TaxID=97028 RepID=A0A392N7H5_9FABA|nr:hypothetical protein [Trifolium medium]
MVLGSGAAGFSFESLMVSKSVGICRLLCIWMTSSMLVLTVPQLVLCSFGDWLWLFRHYQPRGGVFGRLPRLVCLGFRTTFVWLAFRLKEAGSGF